MVRRAPGGEVAEGYHVVNVSGFGGAPITVTDTTPGVLALTDRSPEELSTPDLGPLGAIGGAGVAGPGVSLVLESVLLTPRTVNDTWTPLVTAHPRHCVPTRR